MSDDIHYDYINKLNIKTYKVVRKYKKDLSVFLKVYKILKKSKPDIIHSWSSMCSVYVAYSAKLLGIKFINNFLRDVPSESNYKNKEWVRAKLTFPFSDIIAANSFAGLKAYNVSENKSWCLHNGFDFKRIEGLADKEEVKNKFGIKTRFVIGMVASFSDKKDYDTFIKSAYLVLEKRTDVTFVAVGDGDNFEKIKENIKEDFKDNIKLLGRQKRVLNIVNIFDIGILATYTEGISNSVMEYMALKKPVITTDCGGNRELVENNKTGFLVNAKNPYEIKDKILRLLDDKELQIYFGLNGFNKLEKEFSQEVMGKNFLRLYNNFYK
jgi:glycosyltransferase involved in cell wall biosynthesis